MEMCTETINQSIIFDCSTPELQKHKCNICNFQTDLVVNFKNHKNHEFKCNKCTHCNYQSFSQFLYLKHTLFDPHVDNSALQFPPGQNEWFQCDECSYKSKSMRGIRIHTSTHNKNRRKGDEKLKASDTLFTDLTQNFKWYECDQCPYRSKSDRGLKIHSKKHSRLRRKPENDTDIQFQCNHCPFSSRYKASVFKHEKLRHPALVGIQWLECPQCPYKAKITHYLSRHIAQNHSNQRRFLCEYCSRRFVSEGSLKKHFLAKHTPSNEIEWFYCAHCPLKTKYKSCLAVHLKKVHSDPEKISWFTCEQCPFRTKTKYGVRRHVEVKHENEWFQCDLCDYKGKSMRYLKRHVGFMHKSAEWFKCDQCDYSSRFVWNVKKHKQTTHKLDKEVIKE